MLMPNNIYLSSVKVSLSLGVEHILKENADVSPKDIPQGLPPKRCIEHNMDLIPRTSFITCQPIGAIHKRLKKYKSK